MNIPVSAAAFMGLYYFHTNGSPFTNTLFSAMPAL